MENVDIHYVGIGPLSDTVKAQPSSLSPDLRKPCRTLPGVLPGERACQEQLEVTSGLQAAVFCCPQWDLSVLPGLPRLIFRFWECWLTWVTELGLYIQSSKSHFSGLDLHPWQAILSLFLNLYLPLR